jgi:hypothetical protein
MISLLFVDYGNDQLIKNRRLWTLAEYERQKLLLYALQSLLILLFFKNNNLLNPIFIMTIAPIIALPMVYEPNNKIKIEEPKIYPQQPEQYPEQKPENDTTVFSLQNDRLCVKKMLNHEPEFIMPAVLERKMKVFGDSPIHIKRLEDCGKKAVFQLTKIEYNKRLYKAELYTAKDVTLGELEYFDWAKHFGLDNIKITRDDGEFVPLLEVMSILAGLKVLPKFLGNEFVDPMTQALNVIKVFDIYGNSMKWLNQHKAVKEVFELVINPVISKNSAVLTKQFLDKLIMLVADKKIKNPEEVIQNYKDILQFACEKNCTPVLRDQLQLINDALETIKQKGFEYYYVHRYL